MAEVGCLRDGHFNNLQVEGILIHDDNRLSPYLGGDLVGRRLVHISDLDGAVASTATGVDNDPTDHSGINLFRFSSGVQLYSFNIGAQTLAIPQKVANGFDISGDQTNNEGISYACQIPFGNPAGTGAGSGYAHTNQALKQDPNHTINELIQHFKKGVDEYTVTFTVEITDVSGVDVCMFGVRKIYDRADDTSARGSPHAFRLVGATYTDFACFNVVSGDIRAQHNLSAAGVVDTDVTSDSSGLSGNFSDTEVWKFRIHVDGTGLVTWQAFNMDKGGSFNTALGGALTNITLTSGDYTPFIHIRQDSDLSPVILHGIDISSIPRDPETEVVVKHAKSRPKTAPTEKELAGSTPQRSAGGEGGAGLTSATPHASPQV